MKSNVSKLNLSYEEFLERVEKYHHQFKDNWRIGQTYMNVLSSVRRDVADSIRGTIYDPYNKDVVSKEVENYVKSLW